MEEKQHTIYTDKMEFHVIELLKLPEEWKEENQKILLLAKFINAERKEEFEMLAEKDTYINQAYQRLQVISQDKEKQFQYEAREKAIRDYNQLIYEAKQSGRKEGIQQLVSTLRDFTISDEIILQKIQEKFQLSKEEAEKFL